MLIIREERDCYMKKIAIVVFTAIIALALAGCGSSSASTKSKASAEIAYKQEYYGVNLVSAEILDERTFSFE